ncbi:MAG: hypothetical protein KF819_05350 [Labilithrix sp.]|nr:hypothetical protein [Labilithrix sp.]
MWGRAALVICLVAACGGGATVVAPSSGPEAAGDGGAASGPVDAAPPEKPFAGSALEATQLIGAAVDAKSSEVQKCVEDYRQRKNLPRQRVEVSLGIDQEGRLLGATLKKAKPDPTLSECIQKALAGAPFPRSHSGVISVTKIYEEIEQ